MADPREPLAAAAPASPKSSAIAALARVHRLGGVLHTQPDQGRLAVEQTRILALAAAAGQAGRIDLFLVRSARRRRGSASPPPG